MTRNRFYALVVHCYTATGFLWALLVAISTVKGDYYSACIWMLVAMGVDSTDGDLARRFRVKETLPVIDGRKLDDLADFLNYTFLPIFMILHAGWVPEPRLLWGVIPIVASAFAFSNKGAKEEETGYFLGFPSYWNVFAIYVVIWFSRIGTPWPTVFLIVVFSVMSLLPLKFIYPSRATKWRGFFVWGGVLWIIGLLLILSIGEVAPMWTIYVSLIYPFIYLVSPLLFLSRKTGTLRAFTTKDTKG